MQRFPANFFNPIDHFNPPAVHFNTKTMRFSNLSRRWRSKALVALFTTVSFALIIVARTIYKNNAAASPTSWQGRTVEEVNAVMLFDELTKKPVATFSVANDLPRPIHVVGTSKSCGCFNAELSAFEILPNSASRLDLYMRTNRLQNVYEKSITCTIDLDTGEHREFRVHARILPELMILDKDLSLGELAIASRSERTIPVRAFSYDRNPPQIEVSSASEAVEIATPRVVWSASHEVEKGIVSHDGIMRLMVCPIAEEDCGSAALYAKDSSHDDGSNPPMFLLSWSTSKQWTVTPKRVVLRRADGRQASCQIRISRPDKTECGVSQILSDHPNDIDLSYTVSPNDIQIEMKVAEHCVLPIWGKLIVSIDKDDLHSLNIPYVIVRQIPEP